MKYHSVELSNRELEIIVDELITNRDCLGLEIDASWRTAHDDIKPFKKHIKKLNKVITKLQKVFSDQ